MANQLLTNQELTRLPLMILSNNTVAIPKMTRDLDQEFGKKGNKIGDTIYVRKPARFVGRNGAAYQPEGLTDTQVPVTINQQCGVDFQMSTQELYLSLDEMKKRYLNEAGISIANKLDAFALSMASQNTFNMVGTPGIVPGLSGSDAFLTFLNAGKYLDEMGFPLKGRERCAFITPAMRVGWVSYNKSLFNDSGAISKSFKTGQVPEMVVGAEPYVDQNVYTQTIGALGGTPAVSGANQTGTTLNTSGWTASIAGLLNIGDKISIAGVYSVNPQSRVSTGSLQRFVVQATAASDGGGLSSLTIFPAIVPSGQYQNVTNSPADGALINVYDTAAAGQGALAGVQTPQALLWDKEAFAFVSFPGEVPGGVDQGFAETDDDTGTSLRFVRQFIGATDQWINRYDSYFGAAPLYGEGSVAICG